MCYAHNGIMSFRVTKSKRIVLQNELLVIVVHPIEKMLQALKLYEIIGHTKGLEWTLSRSLVSFKSPDIGHKRTGANIC